MHNEGHWQPPIRPAVTPERGGQSSTTLYELSRNRALDPNFTGSADQQELKRRLDVHGQNLDRQLILEDADSTAIGALRPDTTEILDISEGRVLTDAQLADRGLPPADKGESFHAVVVTGPAGNRSVTAVVSEPKRGGVISLKRLQDINADQGVEFKPRWMGMGNTFRGRYDTSLSVNRNKDWLHIKATGEGSEEALIIRPLLSKTERVVGSGKDYEKSSRRVRKFAIASLALGAAVGVPSAAANMIDDETPAPRSGLIEYDDGQRVEKAGLGRYEEALALYQAEDVEGLQNIINESAFGSFDLDDQYIEKISLAGDIQGITDVVNDALGSVGLDEINLTIPTDTTDKYKGLSSDDVEVAQSAALGVLDFVDEMGPLLERPGGLELQIVGELYSDIQEDGTAQGHYDPADSENAIPIIRLVADTRDMPALMAHEYAHDLSGGTHEGSNRPVIDRGYISLMNPDGTMYDEHDAQDKPGNDLIVGEEVATDYGRTNSSEDISEIFESLNTGNMPDMSAEEAFTVLENKTSGILASVEAIYPGVSAVYFADKLDTPRQDPSRLERAEDGLISSLNKVRSKAAVLTSAFVLLGAASEAYGRLQGRRNKIVRSSAKQNRTR